MADTFVQIMESVWTNWMGEVCRWHVLFRIIQISSDPIVALFAERTPVNARTVGRETSVSFQLRLPLKSPS